MNKNNALIKMLGAFFVYFLYSMYSLTLGKALGVNNELAIMFVSDIIFLVLIVIVYKDNLKKDAEMVKKDYKISKIIKTVILNIVMGAITDVIAPGLAIDNNTEALWGMSKIYTVFKTLIFGVVAEEILFRESLRDVISNNIIFIIVSAIIYTAMHFIFSGLPESNTIIYMAIYFIPAIVSSLAYIKNKSNILILMLIKLVYNLIPLTILF